MSALARLLAGVSALLVCALWPLACVAGVESWTSVGLRSGWRFLAADPFLPGRLYAASANGRFRSMDGGRSWIAVHDAGTSAVAFDLADTTRVYAVGFGTVYRATDGGIQFDFLGHAPFHGITIINAAAAVDRVVVSRHDSNDLYLNDGALSYSSDGGRNFAPLLPPIEGHVYDFALDDAARFKIYAADDAHGVAVSSDNGATWVARAQGLPPGWAGVRIAVEAHDPPRMYVLVGPHNLPSVQYAFDAYRLYTSTDSGATWVGTPFAFDSPVPASEMQLLPIPGSPGSIVVRAGTQVFRSTDGGATFDTVTLRHGDLAQAIATAPLNTLYASGFATGIQRSVDGGVTWEAADGGLPGASIGDVDAIPAGEGVPFTILAATNDANRALTALLRRDTADNAYAPSLLNPAASYVVFNGLSDVGSFIGIRGGPYGFAAFTHTNRSGEAIAITAQGEVLQSTDRGETWQAIGATGVPGALDRIAPAGNTDTLYACGAGHPSATGYSWIDGGLARSDDGGRTWQQLRARPTSNFGCSALAVDPRNAATAYLTISPDIGAGLMLTVDGGKTWNQVPGFNNSLARSIAVDPALPGLVYVAPGMDAAVSAVNTAAGSIGTTAVHPIGDALAATVLSMTLDAGVSPPVLYIGTDRGVYWKSLATMTGPWTALGNSAVLSVTSLRLARSASAPERMTIIAGTTTGVWEYTFDAAHAVVPVYRFYDYAIGAHVYTANPAEREQLQAVPRYADEGVAFRAFAQPMSATLPVYRLYDPRRGVHVYPQTAEERAQAMAGNPELIDEGIAYYALGAHEPGVLALYRFRNVVTGGELSTTDIDERDAILGALPQFQLQSVGAWGYPAGTR